MSRKATLDINTLADQASKRMADAYFVALHTDGKATQTQVGRVVFWQLLDHVIKSRSARLGDDYFRRLLAIGLPEIQTLLDSFAEFCAGTLGPDLRTTEVIELFGRYHTERAWKKARDGLTIYDGIVPTTAICDPYADRTKAAEVT